MIDSVLSYEQWSSFWGYLGCHLFTLVWGVTPYKWSWFKVESYSHHENYISNQYVTVLRHIGKLIMNYFHNLFIYYFMVSYFLKSFL